MGVFLDSFSLQSKENEFAPARQAASVLKANVASKRKEVFKNHSYQRLPHKR